MFDLTRIPSKNEKKHCFSNSEKVWISEILYAYFFGAFFLLLEFYWFTPKKARLADKVHLVNKVK